jgi:hypothetical protein
MGVAGWRMLSPTARVKGSVVAVNWGGSKNWINLNKDGDWSLFVMPVMADAHYANNSAGVTNAPSKGQAAGIIECEILPINSSEALFNSLFKPLSPANPADTSTWKHATVTGTWVEDLSHDNKTEIHPISSVLVMTAQLATGAREFLFCAFSDASTAPVQPYRPLPVPFARENQTATFSIDFPPRPSPNATPKYTIANLPCTRSKPITASLAGPPLKPQLTGQVSTGLPSDGLGLYAGNISVFWQ